jgi:predicted lipid-binding transport protein (Tim44 family)
MDYSTEIVAHSDRFAQFAQRDDTRDLGTMVRRPRAKSGTAALARKITHIGIALAVVFAGMVVLGLVVDGIGLTGLFIALALMLGAILVIGFRPTPAARPVAPYKEDMSNQAVVQRLGSLLRQHRGQLPPAAGQRADAIAGQLPMLEKQLADLNPLDPLAQDARRLVGQHLPDLITRYERVPEQYRRERDGEGMSVDERLVSGLDAARHAIDDLGRQLSRQEVNEFETQGRFIESRYRDDELGTGGRA